MQLSIITVNFNNKKGLQETINSVISQTCKDFEWIVIDGCSTDGSKELIEYYSNNFSYWISEEDKGVYDAMNKGIAASTGQYILFLNSGDTLYSKDTIKLINQDSHNLNDDIIIYDIILRYADKQIKKDLSDLSRISIVSFLFHSSFPHQSTLIKRELFYKNNLYRLDYKYVSDWIFFYKSCVIEDATFVYKKGMIITNYDMNGISTTNRKEASREREKFLTSYYSKQMFDFLKYNCTMEKRNINMNKPIFRFLSNCLQWLSSKSVIKRHKTA